MADTKDTKQQSEELQKIDIISFLDDFFHALRRFWYLILIPAILGGALMYFRTSRVYSPTYTAEATVSVQAVSTGGYYDNSASTAEQLGSVFPYILTSGVLREVVAEDLGTNGMPGNVSVSNISGTNLLTIQVTAGDGQTAYDVLQSFIKNYPAVAQYVVGQTELTVIDDSGVPGEIGVESVLRGSAKRGAMMGAALGLLLVVLYMITFRTIRTSSDLRAVVNAPYLGTLPIYHKKRRSKANFDGINILEDNPQEDYVESIRLIRTRLERNLDAHHVKTIMITSSIPGEGKSTVAGNLAIALAQKGKRVVLVDCDLRNPSSQEVFHAEGEFPGLAKVLNGEASLQDALYKVPEENLKLYCLFGAPHGSQNVEILGKEEMGKLIHAMEKFADVVILDTPPSAMLVDASILVKYVHSALYVVLSDYARRQYIMKGLEELNELGINIEGCVLNGGRESSSMRSRR